MRTTLTPFSSFGWTLAGALALGLSFPPTGFYPLAWVALVPWLVRWRMLESTADLAREIYAAALVWSCSAGFWLLFHPDASHAAAGGLGILLVPIPLTLAFVASHWVRRRYGIGLGLTTLVLNVLAMEYAMLHMKGGVPWLLLGHTQATATAFVQIADLGGVLLVSAWVLAVNIVASVALAHRTAAPNALPSPLVPRHTAERGMAVALLSLLVVLPVLYGAAQSARPVGPVGFTRVGVVQPGLSPDAWDDQSATERIDALASLSASLLSRWRGASREAMSDSMNAHLTADGTPRSIGLLIWPQASLPDLGTDERDARLVDRLTRWTAQEGVDLMAGTTLPLTSATRTVSETTDDGHRVEREERASASAALLVRAQRGTLRYDQMRRLPMADAKATRGSSRTLFPAGGARLATTLGFESLFGDHVRVFARDGADAVVVLAQNGWWGRGGAAQHLAFTRLRAIETRRSVLVSAVGGGSSLVTPGGEVQPLAGWMQPALVPLDLPLYRESTFYLAHGDWVGRGALWLGLIANMILVLLSRAFPAPTPTKRMKPAARPR